ncbi:MAG: cytochrome c [Planctomycetes bacterium]|nr:cytochrome c [Planctomycetota bacterium]
MSALRYVSRANRRRVLWAVYAATLALSAGAGCRQRMADQPYYRPLEHAEFFPDGRASRPIERGTIHRAQRLETDPIATGLTREEWERSYEYAVPPTKVDVGALNEPEKILRAVGAPRYNPLDPAAPKVYVNEFPFPIDQAALKRGQERYTVFCAVCHGPLGNGQGKIWERGYLNPTSFHTHKVDPKEVTVSNPQGLGISRGFSLWGHTVPMDRVPPGYIFEVVTKGYGGMPSYSAQIPAADRWKIVAYIRVLQMSQGGNVSPEIKKLLDAAGGKQ